MEEYPDSPSLEGEDVFPCKGCGEILEEGKAFELAGNRWHLDCFRCNTCSTLLDSDANLLLLGDGSLICNNCTYSCTACGDKIEDLAILTGDQAFCASCFRCRNCKRKIENLRYARTSQGIFCMSCHESLMARRRKKSKAAAQAKAREKEASPMVEKSLPALPPSAIPPNAFSDDRVDPDSDTPTELSPRPRPSYSRNESSSKSLSGRTDRSPERETPMSLPATTYRNNRHSSVFTTGDNGSNTGDDAGFFIPVALDPTPVTTGSKDKDYFSIPKEKESQSSTPHIAFQEKGRQPSSEYESTPPSRDLGRHPSKSSRSERDGASSASPAVGDDRSQKFANGKTRTSEEFKLQEAPRRKKSEPQSSSQNAIHDVGSRGGSISRRDKETLGYQSPTESPQLSQAGTPGSPPDPRHKENESRANNSTHLGMVPLNSKPIPRKEVPRTLSNGDGKPASVSSNSQGHEEMQPPPRPSLSEQNPNKSSYTAPRAAPSMPSHTPGKESIASVDMNESKTSPKLPRWSSGGDFSMDEDMARILGADDPALLRRVSQAVRHGRTLSSDSSSHRMSHNRSVSETTGATVSPRFPKPPTHTHSHTHKEDNSLGTAADDPAFLKRQLRNSEQRVAELERQFSADKNLKNVTQRLEEKRKTVSVLDTQTEIMIRQLEVLAGYVERAKDTGRPINPQDLEESALKDFVQKLEKLKQSMSATLEQLHAERDDLLEEKNQAISDRDRARAEFDQLVSKNTQLADLNNDLTHQIQQRFKGQSTSNQGGSTNGLGIYQHSKGTASSINLDSSSMGTGTTIIAPDNEEQIVEAGPTVVKIGKGQVVKKFNWKKGTKGLAHNIAKGVNRGIGNFQQAQPRDQAGSAGDNIGLPYNMTVQSVESPVQVGPNLANNNMQSRQAAADRQGFFSFKKANAPNPRGFPSSVSSPTVAAEPPTVLFGSELAERADFERRQIPCVVTRCIEEVELRGMDMEGIYRKTGGNSQTKQIQEGFDKNDNYDISDPDLDITAVTSALKQYFRKLPTPLLSFDIYDELLATNAIPDNAGKCAHLRAVLNQLAPQHKDCLEFLMFHLSRVAGREKENLMTPKNLSVVFAPTIMRGEEIEREMTDMHAKNSAVQFMIENSHNIFS